MNAEFTQKPIVIKYDTTDPDNPVLAIDPCRTGMDANAFIGVKVVMENRVSTIISAVESEGIIAMLFFVGGNAENPYGALLYDPSTGAITEPTQETEETEEPVVSGGQGFN